YRYPLVPLLVPFAAAGIIQAIRWARRRETGPLLRCGAAGLATAVVANLPMVTPNAVRAATHYNLAVTLGELPGREQDAEAEYQTAIRLVPNYPESHYNLGLLLAAADKTAEAIDQFAAAIQIRPDYIKARYALANMLVDRGELAPAIEHYRA